MSSGRFPVSVGRARVELATVGLKARCSTIELTARVVFRATGHHLANGPRVVKALASPQQKWSSRATGAVADNKSDDNNTALGESAQEKIAAAVRAERHALLAKAQHSVAAAELEVAREKDNEENADERLQAARQQELSWRASHALRRCQPGALG